MASRYCIDFHTKKSIEKSMLSFIQFTHRIFVLVYNHFSSEMLQLYTLTLRGGEIRAFIYHSSEWTLPK